MTAIRVPLTALKKKFWLVCENQVNRWQRIKKMCNPMQIVLRRVKKAKKLDKTKKNDICRSLFWAYFVIS